MMLINLLPHREWARKRRRQQFYAQIGLAVTAGVLIGIVIFLFLQWQINRQESRNQLLRSEIAQLDLQIKDIASLQAQLNALQSRQAGVESLQADRNLPVYLLDELVKQLPEGVYLRTMRQEGMVIQITAVAQSQERVSELLRNIGAQSLWLSQPQLVEIVATNVSLERNQSRRAFNFTLRLQLAKSKPEVAEAR
jgi:type IV pilus assembly protein PilN